MLKDYLELVFKLEMQQHHLTCGKRSSQTYYGLTSLSPAKASSTRLLTLKRHYWGIENRLHYQRDVSLNEDRCRLRRGHAARMMAIINNLVLALIDRLDFPTVPEARCCFSAKPSEALNLIFQNPATTLQ